jgi:hypothetical protein
MLVDAIDSFLQHAPPPPPRRPKGSGWGDRIALRRPFPVLGGRQRKSADQLRT